MVMFPALYSGGLVWRLMGIAMKAVYSLVGIVCVLMGLLWYFQEGLLFHPDTPSRSPDKNPVPLQNPGQMQLTYEDVWITTRDGVRVHAWLVKNADYSLRPTLIFFQGNAGNMGYRLRNIKQLQELCNINVLAVSYRGYGYSNGSPSEDGLYIDAEAALDYLLSRRDIDPNQIIVFGRSLGGAIAVYLGWRRPENIKLVIVENTFTSLRDMAMVVFPPLKVVPFLLPFAQRIHLDSLSKVKTLPIPIMYISGLQDALVPPSHSTRLYESTPSPLRHLYQVPKGNHDDTWQQGIGYYSELRRFISQVLEPVQQLTSKKKAPTCEVMSRKWKTAPTELRIEA